MAEKKSVGHAYNVDFLNVVFAASSIFLFLVTIWMVWDDYDREWKNTQRRFTQLDMEVTRAQIAAADKGVNPTKLKGLQTQLAVQEKAMAANQAKIQQLQDQIASISARIDRETQDYQFAKANYDVHRYSFEVERDKGKTGAEDQKTIDDEGKKVADLNLIVEKSTAERAALQAELGKYTGQAADIQKQIDAMYADKKRLQTRLETIAPSLSKTLLRDAPMT